MKEPPYRVWGVLDKLEIIFAGQFEPHSLD